MKKSDLFRVGFIMFVAVIAFVMGILYLQDIKLQKSNFKKLVNFQKFFLIILITDVPH